MEKMNKKDDLDISMIDDGVYDEEAGHYKLGDDDLQRPEDVHVDVENPFASLQNSRQKKTCLQRMLNLVLGTDMESPEFDKSPDDDFYADNLIELTHGFTAYRLLEPSFVETLSNIDNSSLNNKAPVIVLLHGLQNSSYMWADVAELLADFEQGPQANIVVFDFYGHGRSPWMGVPMSLDLLVQQTRELLDALGFAGRSVSLIGYELGGAVAVGFAARYPQLTASMTLIAPLGLKYKSGLQEKQFASSYWGEIAIAKQKKELPELQLKDFYNKDSDASHRFLIERQINMCYWQLQNSPGYLGALLSTFRNFPLRNMEELFSAVGRHRRPVLVIWGMQDEVCAYDKCIRIVEETFPDSVVVDIEECGHNCVLEKFDEVVTEILEFHYDIAMSTNSNNNNNNSKR